MKLTIFFSTKKMKNKTKPMCNSESTSKIKMGSRWTFFKIHVSAFICI